MYGAVLEMGWVRLVFTGDSPVSIIKQADKIADFECMLTMGRSFEEKKGQLELDKLQCMVDKYHSGTITMEDIKRLSVHLSSGEIVCHGIAEGEEAISGLH